MLHRSPDAIRKDSSSGMEEGKFPIYISIRSTCTYNVMDSTKAKNEDKKQYDRSEKFVCLMKKG